MPEILPIDQPQFWATRLLKAVDRNEIHRSVFDVSLSQWYNIQSTHRDILSYLKPGMRVLDAGCGYGALLEILPEGLDYTGIDLSPDLVVAGRRFHPQHCFVRADLRKLAYPDQHFHITVCRSLEGMTKEHLGHEVWEDIEKELLRVSKCVLLLNYTRPATYTELKHEHPELNTLNAVQHSHGRLYYRLGLGGICEIHDVFVDRDYRRQGIGTSMFLEVIDKGFQTVYGFVREDNEPMLALQHKIGFTHVLVPSLYPGGGGYYAYLSGNRRPRNLA